MVNKKQDNTNYIQENEIISAAFQAIIARTQDMIFVKDMDLVYVAASQPFVNMVGKKHTDDILNRRDTDIFEDKNLAMRYIADDKRLLSGGVDLIDYIEPIAEEDGHARYGSTSKYILRNQQGTAIGILGITKDITREYITRQHYQQELKYLFELPPDTYAVSYIDIDSWRIISQRRQLIGEGTLQACNTVEELSEAAVESIVDKENKVADFYSNFTKSVLQEIYNSGRRTISFSYQRKISEKEVRWVHNEIRFLTDVDSGHLCAMLTAKDIDEEKKAEQKLVVAAQMDKMTMVLNRETTMEAIRQILSNENNHLHVLFMIDVDNFKHLNDTLGHQTGDQFLIALAKEIKSIFRESDIVGRIGGDEFFALMRNVPELAMTIGKAQELLKTVQRVGASYSDIYLSGSIGISVYPDNGSTIEELYAQADDALYQAKRKGKNQFVFASLE